MNKTEALLDLFLKKIEDNPLDKALSFMLLEYKDKLPEINEEFHKSFRQKDITGSGKIDLAIWHLLNGSDVFWDCFNQVKN